MKCLPIKSVPLPASPLPSSPPPVARVATFIFENVQKSTICFIGTARHIGNGGKGDRTLCLVIELYFTHKIYLFMIWRSEAKARKSNLNSFASCQGCQAT